MIIVIGSIVGMMGEIFESKQAPLYGRKTSEIFIKPFEFWDIRKLLKIFGVKSDEAIVNMYSILGGMPKYYDQIDRLGMKFNLESALELFTEKVYSVWKAPRDELIEEFREAHTTYFSILEAIAKGKVSANEIASYTMIPEKSIYKYLNQLVNYFELIEKRKPALAPKKLQRGTLQDKRSIL